MWRPVVAVLLLMLPGAGAFTSFEDKGADVRMATSDDHFGIGAAGGQWPNLDLRAGGVYAETDDQVTFFVNVTRLEPQQDPPVPRTQPRYELFFYYGSQGYRLTGITDLDTPDGGALGQPEARGEIAIEYQEGVFNPLTNIELELDFDENQVRWLVPRVLIKDHNEAPLGRGEWLTDMRASSRAAGWYGVPVDINNFQFYAGTPAFLDDAPDNGDTGDDYLTRAGRQLHGGDLLASSHDPVRWTNGEATTFVYFIRLENTGNRNIGVQLGHEGTDPTWQVAFSDAMTVPARSVINATYHVAIPFGHAHGKLDHFDVTFASDDGNHWARQPLAVYWPNIPQPAGHHNQLWMHARSASQEPPMDSVGPTAHGWWSAADSNVEAYDEKIAVPADRFVNHDDGTVTAEWVMRLEPSLRMGLDFIVEQPVTGTLLMEFPVPMQDAVLEFELVHLNTRTIIPRETPVLLAEIPLPGMLDGAVTIPIEDVFVFPEADMIRHSPKAELEFRYRLSGTHPGYGSSNAGDSFPRIDSAGSELFLPLVEYHDPLETVFFTDATAQILVGDEGQEKRVNPGNDVVFTFNLDYRGTFETDFRVELSGPHSEWARVLGDPTFTVEPHEPREVAVAIQPPATAANGDYAEVTVKVVNVHNAAIQAGFIVRADVDTRASIADESDVAAQKAQTLRAPSSDGGVVWPWLVFPPILLVAVALVVWRVRPEWLPFLR